MLELSSRYDIISRTIGISPMAAQQERTSSMTTRTPTLGLLAIAIAFGALDANEAMAQSTSCDTPVTQPPGGPVATNLSAGQEEVMIRLEFTSYSSEASYACVSNYPDFPPPDPEKGALFYCYPLTGQGQVVPQWTLSPGFNHEKHVYVQYNRCQAPQPSTVNPVIDIQTSYWPVSCDQPIVPPAGGFQATVAGGSTVTSPNIQLQFVAGNAAFAQVSNSPDFSDATLDPVGYPFDYTLDWTLTPGYGTKTVYVRFLNYCETQPTPTIAVSVNYPNPTCVSAINTNGLMITSQGPTNVKLGYPTYVTVVPHGNNANWVQISNSFNFANSTWYKIATNPTIVRALPPGTGSKTVWAQYWFKNDGCPDVKASYAVSISFAVTR